MKKLIKNTILSLLVICLTLTCMNTTPVSAAAPYKKSATKTVSVKASEYYALVTVTVKKDTTVTCTVKPKDNRECTMISPASKCKCSTCTSLYHAYSVCDCDSETIDSLCEYAAPKYTGKIKLTKGTHTLRIDSVGDSTHPYKQTVKLNIKTANGKNLIRIDKVEKKKY